MIANYNIYNINRFNRFNKFKILLTKRNKKFKEKKMNLKTPLKVLFCLHHIH